jgi:acyl-CoA reductase-like NAD-dependent aldehyde dehydrogenase
MGGKSPAIIANDYPLEQAVQSILSGKLLNAGQTCIAPDYVFVPRARQQDFVAKAQQHTARLYPTLAGNPDYTSIVSDRHFQRLQRMTDEARQAGVQVVELNPTNESLGNQRKIAPTLLLDPGDELAVMREEIFGPLLPVKAYDDISETIDYVNRHARPLALYVFSNDTAVVDRILTRTVSGGVTVNDTLYHVAAEDLPFGGVGASGIGAYHGWEGFATFSHAKGTFYQSKRNLGGLLRPPYGARMDKLLKFMLRRSL